MHGPCSSFQQSTIFERKIVQKNDPSYMDVFLGFFSFFKVFSFSFFSLLLLLASCKHFLVTVKIIYFKECCLMLYQRISMLYLFSYVFETQGLTLLEQTKLTFMQYASFLSNQKESVFQPMLDKHSVIPEI